MKLIVQPDAGIAPVITAIKLAKKTIDVLIFRLDRHEITRALEAAVARGVAVRALIAHTNSSGEKSLRTLELRLLEQGVTVSRTASDLVRYHGKMMIVDHRVLHVRLQLHGARHREEPQLRHHDDQREIRPGSVEAVRGRRRAPALRPLLRPVRRQPRDRARPSGGIHQRGAQAAADLRPESERSGDVAPARRPRRRRRGGADDREALRQEGGVAGGEIPREASPHSRDRPRRPPRVPREPEPRARSSSRSGAKWASS